MATKTRNGFTLVELLVVIAIIGLLAALLVPAIGAAREQARLAQCTNNMRTVGQAMVAFATSKQRFPGRIENAARAGANPRVVSWVAKILPQLQRNDLWDTFLSNNQTNFGSATTQNGVNLASSYVESVVCPSDPQVNQAFPWLSYGVNSGAWISGSFGVPDIRESGVCHDLADLTDPSTRQRLRAMMEPFKVTPAMISQEDGATNTMLATENVNLDTWAVTYSDGDAFPPEAIGPRLDFNFLRNSSDINVYESRLSVVWSFVERQEPVNQFETIGETGRVRLVEVFASDAPPRWVRPASLHSNGVVAAYADGHAQLLSQETDPVVVAKLMAWNDRKLAQQWGTALFNNDANLQAAFAQPLTESDRQ